MRANGGHAFLLSMGMSVLVGASGQAAALSGQVFKKGNPVAALDFPSEVNESNLVDAVEKGDLTGLSISKDRNGLVSGAGHFSVSSTYATDVDEKGFEKNKSELDYSVTDTRFGIVNTAYWINQSIAKLKQFQIGENDKFGIRVDAHCENMANAHFSPFMNVICLGYLFDTLGRDALQGMGGAAWDGDVVVHEFGHGVFHHLSASMPFTLRPRYYSLANDQIGAMNEGQADFQAYVVTSNTKLAPWFMKGINEVYGTDDLYLRAVDNTYNFRKDVFGEIHADGQIFAAALFDLAKAIGGDEALRLWYNAISRVTDMDGFHEFGQYVLTADEDLNDGKNADAIQAAFEGRGIFGNASAKLEEIEVHTQIIDKPGEIQAVRDSVERRLGSRFPEGDVEANGDGKLNAGECVALELSVKNNQNEALVGTELFIPRDQLPEGAYIIAANRSYIGVVPTGKTVPEKVIVRNAFRPFIYVCANENYREGGEFQVLLRNASKMQPMAYATGFVTTRTGAVELPVPSLDDMFGAFAAGR